MLTKLFESVLAGAAAVRAARAEEMAKTEAIMADISSEVERYEAQMCRVLRSEPPAFGRWAGVLAWLVLGGWAVWIAYGVLW